VLRDGPFRVVLLNTRFPHLSSEMESGGGKRETIG
jgi:hypothetical protein